MQNRLASLLAAMVFGLGVMVAGHLPAIAVEPVQLTVIGKVENSNRSESDEFSDAFLKFREKEFTRAFELSYSALAAMPQVTVTAKAEKWPAAITAAGPSLEDVMKAAGAAPDAKLSFVALDGYTIELEAADRRAQNWILAISSNSKPLGIGGRGPVWLLHDTGGKSIDSNAEGRWVWSVFVIEVD